MISFLKRLLSISTVAISLGGSAFVAHADVSLDAQIAAFSNAGLTLAKARTKSELLESFGEEEYFNEPYSLLLFMYGSEVESEPWGRYFSNRVWNFDFESIADDESYSQIVYRLAVISGANHLLSDVNSSLDWDNQQISLTYKLGEIERSLTPKFDSDWADEVTIEKIIADIVATKKDGKQFWAADNGQAVILLYLSDEDAAKLNALSEGLVKPWQ